MRVLLVSHNVNNINSGAQRVYIRLADNLRALGIEVDLLHLEDMEFPESRSLGLIIKRFALPAWISWKVSKLDLTRYDVIMTSSGMLYPLYRRLRKTQKRPLLVNHIHGLCVYDHISNINENELGHWKTSLSYKLVTGPFQIDWDTAGIRSSDRIVVQNLRDLSYVEKAFPEAQLSFIPPAIYASIIDHIIQMESSVERDRFGILYFASWESRKGSYYIPEAIRLVRSQFPEATLTIGGVKGDFDDILAQFAPEDRPFVKFIKNVSLEEHVEVMLKNGIFLFPSLSEGFGLAALEAGAAGMVVIGSPTGFCADSLIDGVSGRVVQVTSRHIAKAIIEVIEDPDYQSSIAAEGRRVAASFTENAMAQAYLDVFEAR